MAKELIINGKRLPDAELHARMAQVRSAREAETGMPLDLEARLELREEVLQILVDRMLIIQEAKRLTLMATQAEVDGALLGLAQRFDGVAGCRAGSDMAEQRDAIADRILVDKVVSRWRAGVQRPAAGKIREYYRLNQSRFYMPEKVHASHIVRQFEDSGGEEAARRSIEDLHRQVTGGEDFGRVAACHSSCPENGGDLGWFASGMMVKEFDDVVFSAPTGQITPIFRTEFGFHFAVVHARKAAGLLPFNEVRDQIQSTLWLADQDQEVGRALAELRTKAIVTRES